MKTAKIASVRILRNVAIGTVCEKKQRGRTIWLSYEQVDFGVNEVNGRVYLVTLWLEPSSTQQRERVMSMLIAIPSRIVPAELLHRVTAEANAVGTAQAASDELDEMLEKHGEEEDRA